MSSEGEENNSLGRSSKGNNRIPRCSLCRNHGYVVDLKNHKRYCKWKNCKCVACLGTIQKRKVNANQVAARRAAKQDSELGEPPSVESTQPVSIGFPAQTLQLGALPPRLSPMPPEEPSFSVYDTFKRVKDGINFLQTQYQSLKLDCEKLNTERANIQRYYDTYYEMSYGLKMEMHKQAEISKRLNAIIAQILPYLTVEHQQQVIAAVDRAKQITMNELNGFTRFSDAFPHLPRDTTLLPPISHATSPPFTPSTSGLCPSPRGNQAPSVIVGGREGLQPLIPLPNVSLANSVSVSHLPHPPPQQPISANERDHEQQRQIKKKPAEPENPSRSPVIVECHSATAVQPQKEGQNWPAELATNNNSRDADCEDSDGYRSDQESILDVVNEDPRSPMVAGGIRNGVGYGDKNEDLTRRGFSVLAHSEFRQLGSEWLLQERPLSVAARM